MKTYHFEIKSDLNDTLEVLDAADDAAAVRQAVLLLSEILRDHALAPRGDMAVRISVRDMAGRPIWEGASYVHGSAQ